MYAGRRPQVSNHAIRRRGRPFPTGTCGGRYSAGSGPRRAETSSRRSVRRRQRACARHADRRSLDRTQVGKDLVRVGQGSPVAAQDGMRRIIGIDRPIGPLDRGQREARIVRSGPVIAALDEVLQVGEPLALRPGSRGIQICSGVGRAEFSEPDRRRGDCRMTGVAPGIGSAVELRIHSACQVEMRPKLHPDVRQAGGTAAALIAGGGVEPRLHEKRRPVVVRRVHDLVVDGRAERRGVAAFVEQHRRAGVRAVAVHPLQITAPPGAVIGSVDRIPAIRRIHADALDEDERQVPAIGIGLAQDGRACPLGCQAPIVAGGGRHTGRREGVRVGIDVRIDPVAGAPGGAVQVITVAGCVRLVTQIQSDNDRIAVGGIVIHRYGVGGPKGLGDAMRPAQHADPICDPDGLRETRGIPQAAFLGRVAFVGAVVIQDDVQADCEPE